MERKIKQVSSHKYFAFSWKKEFSALTYENHFSWKMDNKRTFPTGKKKEVLCAFYQIWSCDDDVEASSVDKRSSLLVKVGKAPKTNVRKL